MKFLFRLRRNMYDFRLDRRAVTAIEYALIASLVAVAIIGGVKAIGVSLTNTFTYISGQL
jgi:pilus assembly protein Flp/PilA